MNILEKNLKIIGYEHPTKIGVYLKNTKHGYTFITEDGRINPSAVMAAHEVEKGKPIYEGELTIKL